jgi:hypothetical protein
MASKNGFMAIWVKMQQMTSENILPEDFLAFQETDLYGENFSNHSRVETHHH